MFNVGPLELLVLAFVGIVVLGPDRLPGLARDAGRLIRTLREVATGARTQLREELGPEFADIDLRSLNPRTAITQALLGDDFAPGSLGTLSGRNAWQRALLGEPGTAGAAGVAAAAGVAGVTAAAGGADDPAIKPVTSAVVRPAPTPLARGESAPFDLDAT